MEFYFAPLEGVTDAIFRRVHRKHFPSVSRYYTPFFSPTVHRALTPREARELPPADALDVQVVPQLLTKSAEDFCWMSGVCKDLGYKQVNLNLGCPSGTVTAKGKGAGMLADLQALERFLDGIFQNSALPISIKTRLGMKDPEEFYSLLELYNRYPIIELTVHPRVRADFYNGKPNMELFDYAVQNSKNKLIYNGNLCTCSQIDEFSRHHPTVGAVMIGRGLIADPALLCERKATGDQLKAYHDELLEEYLSAFGGSRNAMFRLKEHWHCMLQRFDADDKLKKRLRKVTDLSEYRAITAELFCNTPLLPDYTPDW